MFLYFTNSKMKIVIVLIFCLIVNELQTAQGGEDECYDDYDNCVLKCGKLGKARRPCVEDCEYKKELCLNFGPTYDMK
ncbi:unnamed protein product [Calicophoron daubneyi]|uniref:Uncharacterized protein n=1 Tax=Calicophoron daubneyi TaxID=300641 RepID=A0AAV2TAA2_CALDB